MLWLVEYTTGWIIWERRVTIKKTTGFIFSSPHTHTTARLKKGTASLNQFILSLAIITPLFSLYRLRYLTVEFQYHTFFFFYGLFCVCFNLLFIHVMCGRAFFFFFSFLSEPNYLCCVFSYLDSSVNGYFVSKMEYEKGRKQCGN